MLLSKGLVFNSLSEWSPEIIQMPVHYEDFKIIENQLGRHQSS